MRDLEISETELSGLAEHALDLVLSYWKSLADRPAYPVTSGRETVRLFSRAWREEGIGPDVLQDFATIAQHSRPSGGGFFAYVFGSGEPVGAIGDFLATALNQNVSSWRSSPAATAIEHCVVGWMAEAVGCSA